MSRSILLIDDDPSVLYLHSRYFRERGWEVFRALTGEIGIELYESHSPDVVVLDLAMPGMDGFDVLEKLTRLGAMVILLTAHGQVENAVRAVKLGAENFLTKPVKLDHLGAIVDRAAEKAELRRRNQHLSDQIETNARPLGLGRSPQMRALARQIEMAIEWKGPCILITGEAGIGKGVVARSIHTRSDRKEGPFEGIDCTGFTDSNLDLALFGQEAGAFVETEKVRKGLLETSSGGTLLIEEIDRLGIDLQKKLESVLTNGTFRRVGGKHEIRANFRLIATTSRDLAAEVSAGRFQSGLLARLEVRELYLPPLRERTTSDLLHLIQTILDERAQNSAAVLPISDQARAMLVGYDWPGNVGELREVLNRAQVLAVGGDEVLPEHLPEEIREHERGGAESTRGYSAMSLKDVEMRHIENTLIAHGGNKTRAADALGISRTTLHNKIKSYGISEIRAETEE